ncbi:MAG: hypothetical protein HC830_13095 [Bacteroidetes bacterium]|nr:hypothetical protein [Bacteroidota bacterium]
MTFTITTDQAISLYNFFKATTQFEPDNFQDWGKDWIITRGLYKCFGNIFKPETDIKLNSDQFFSIFNMLALYVDTIKEKQLGENLFNEMLQLFKHIHSFSGIPIPSPVFCYHNYNAPQRTIKINTVSHE